MIVDPTVIQLKNSLQSYYIIKINPDYIKLCWNRPQLFALLKRLLESSSRRYIWVSGRYIWGLFLFSAQVWEENTLFCLKCSVGAENFFSNSQKSSSLPRRMEPETFCTVFCKMCKKKEIWIHWICAYQQKNWLERVAELSLVGCVQWC